MLGNHAIIGLFARLLVLFPGAGDEGGAVISNVLASLSLEDILASLVFDCTEFIAFSCAFLGDALFKVFVDFASGVDETFDSTFLIDGDLFTCLFLVNTEPKSVGGAEESSSKEDSGVHCFFVLFVVFIEVSLMSPFICHKIAENGLFPRN